MSRSRASPSASRRAGSCCSSAEPTSATCSTWRARASRGGPAGRRRRSCRRRSASGGRRLRRWVGAGVRCRHLPAGRRSGGGDAGDAHRAAAEGPTPDGVRASTVVVLLSPERDRGQPARIGHVARLAASTPRSPECAGRWSRSSASPSSSRSAEGAQKRSTATPCSSPPGTGESSRCTTTSRPSSTHAVEATVPGWNQ
jgi:hypothetical protein